ncbi:MAG: hypothetical protein WBX11_17185 [Thiobacillaceae bacterium]|jgi:hypothetical protein
MKTVSLPNASVAFGADSHHRFVERIRPLPRMLVSLLRRQAHTFPAIALAEAGDSEGATELLKQGAGKKS